MLTVVSLSKKWLLVMVGWRDAVTGGFYEKTGIMFFVFILSWPVVLLQHGLVRARALTCFLLSGLVWEGRMVMVEPNCDTKVLGELCMRWENPEFLPENWRGWESRGMGCHSLSIIDQSVNAHTHAHTRTRTDP